MSSINQNERYSLLSMFSVEVWLNILNRVDNISDYDKICQASPVIASLFEPLRTKILFPRVVKILLNYPKQIKETVICEKDLLPLRFLCSSWRKSIDGILQNLEFRYTNPMEKYTRLSFQVEGVRQAAVFKDYYDLHDFMNQFDGNVNPFITRSVLFVFTTNGGQLESFYSHLLELLREFGHHVWYCEIKLALLFPMSQVNHFEQLGEILALMPNLKRFQFNAQLDPAINNCAWSDLLKIAMLRHPIPTLNNLEFVRQNGMPVPVLQNFVKGNPHITTVDCKNPTGKHLEFYLEEMPNLQALAVDLSTLSDFANFQDLAIVCRLVKLNIQMPLAPVSWESVFSLLNFCFADTLQELCIFLPNSNGKHKPEDDGVLRLPKLKELTISTRHIIGLDFLLPMANNLEKLSLMVQKFGLLPAYQERYTIKVNHINGLVYNTNVWNVMEKLNVLNLRFEDLCENSYTRKSWSRLKIKQKS